VRQYEAWIFSSSEEGAFVRANEGSSPTMYHKHAEIIAAMKIVPLGDKVVVKRTEADEITAGGIMLPESAKERPQQGRILSVGEGRLLKDGSRAEPQVSEGDRVLFTSYAGTEVTVDDEDLLIMSEEDLLAVLD
jgi:chaperonin GroES